MIGNRLKRAREAVGLSLRDLEGAIHGQVSAQAIGKYERGEMMPGSTVLLALSKALHITPEFLLSEREVELTGVDFRKAPQAGAKEERAVEASVLDQVERYLELEELLPGMDDAWAAPDGPEFEIHRVEDAEQAADSLRKLWSLGIDPIPIMAELLEDKGVKVIAPEAPGPTTSNLSLSRRISVFTVPISESVLPVDGNALPAGHYSARLGSALAGGIKVTHAPGGND